jgi:hypothetical protein
MDIAFQGLHLPASAFQSMATKAKRNFDLRYVEGNTMYASPELEEYEDDFVRIAKDCVGPSKEPCSAAYVVTPKNNVFLLTNVRNSDYIKDDDERPMHYVRIEGKLKHIERPYTLVDNTILRTPQRILIVNLPDEPLSFPQNPYPPNFAPAIQSQGFRGESHGV